VVALAVQRIGGDQDPAQVRQGAQHRGEGGDLVPTGEGGMDEDQPVGVVVDAHELGLRGIRLAGPAPAVLRGSEPSTRRHSEVFDPPLGPGLPARVPLTAAFDLCPVPLRLANTRDSSGRRQRRFDNAVAGVTRVALVRGGGRCLRRDGLGRIFLRG
jgi:hypothetical protein